MSLNDALMEMRKIHLDFYTEYHQFFIHDKGFPIDPSYELWTNQAHKDRLAISSGLLSVRTACYGPLKGELILLDKQNHVIDLSEYDHVVEGSIHCESGTLEIIACMSNEPDVSLDVPPDIYRVRIYSSGLNSVVGDEGDDFYRLEIWKDSFSERRILKSL